MIFLNGLEGRLAGGAKLWLCWSRKWIEAKEGFLP